MTLGHTSFTILTTRRSAPTVSGRRGARAPPPCSGCRPSAAERSGRVYQRLPHAASCLAARAQLPLSGGSGYPALLVTCANAAFDTDAVCSDMTGRELRPARTAAHACGGISMLMPLVACGPGDEAPLASQTWEQPHMGCRGCLCSSRSRPCAYTSCLPPSCDAELACRLPLTSGFCCAPQTHL